jgi:hypothetical protein
VIASALSYAVWGLILVGLFWVCAASLRHPPLAARPRAVLTRLSTQPVLRVCLVLTFMWLGWHLFAR